MARESSFSKASSEHRNCTVPSFFSYNLVQSLKVRACPRSTNFRGFLQVLWNRLCLHEFYTRKCIPGRNLCNKLQCTDRRMYRKVGTIFQKLTPFQAPQKKTKFHFLIIHTPWNSLRKKWRILYVGIKRKWRKRGKKSYLFSNDSPKFLTPANTEKYIYLSTCPFLSAWNILIHRARKRILRALSRALERPLHRFSFVIISLSVSLALAFSSARILRPFCFLWPGSIIWPARLFSRKRTRRIFLLQLGANLCIYMCVTESNVSRGLGRDDARTTRTIQVWENACVCVCVNIFVRVCCMFRDSRSFVCSCYRQKKNPMKPHETP